MNFSQMLISQTPNTYRSMLAVVDGRGRNDERRSQAPPLDVAFVPYRARPDNVVRLLQQLGSVREKTILLPSDGDSLADRHELTAMSAIKPGAFDRQFRSFYDGLRMWTIPRLRTAARNWDLPLKRTFALWHARRRQLRTVLLIDDDIDGISPSTIADGVSSLGAYRACGAFVDDFPDVSVVDHLSLAVGERIEPFISGSYLFISLDTNTPFFAPIYNEDWLFLLPYICRREACATGTIGQLPYDPFASPATAEFQEFGDLVVDGLFALLSWDSYEDRFRGDVWQELIELRRTRLAQLAARVTTVTQREALGAAMRASEGVNSEECLAFLESWEWDLETWARLMREQ